MNVLSAIALGANAGEQATKFAFSLLFGLAGGIFALLYFRKAGALERALTDLFATIMLGAIYIASAEVLSGKPEIYCMVAYAIGAAVVPSAFSLLRRAIKRRGARKK